LIGKIQLWLVYLPFGFEGAEGFSGGRTGGLGGTIPDPGSGLLSISIINCGLIFGQFDLRRSLTKQAHLQTE
jgi:hypothetical protein